MFIIMSCIGNASIWRCPRRNEKLWNLYHDNKDSDGFLYLKMGNKERINWNKLSQHCGNYQNDMFINKPNVLSDKTKDAEWRGAHPHCF